MLQVIISPAKQMEVRADAFAPRGIPPFPRQTEVLHRALLALEREGGAAALQELWRVSDRLLAQNIERLHRFAPVASKARLDDPAIGRLVSPAAFSYVGIQYRSLAPEVLDLDALDWLQGHLWILSGMYGCARPFDAVEPYRLEMGAQLAVNGARNLYEFWGSRIAEAVCGAGAREAEGTDAGPVTVVNLASIEYAKAVLPHLPADAQAVTCIFGEELRGNRPVQRATASKIARGSMVRWMAEHGIEDVGDLVRFDIGYRFAPELSDDPDNASDNPTRTLVFMAC